MFALAVTSFFAAVLAVVIFSGAWWLGVVAFAVVFATLGLAGDRMGWFD